jgi:hypothetical protein
MAKLRKFDVEQLSADQFAAKMKDPDFKAEFEALYPVEIQAPVETIDPEGFSVVQAPAAVTQQDSEGVVAPIAPAPTPAADVEQRYEYQPVDKHGRKVGGLQVIKYKTQDELVKKLTENHIEAIRWGREEHAARVVGKPVEDDGSDIPADAERGSVEFVELKAKPLTTEERFAIIQDMQDPAKFEEGRARLFESEFGVPTSKVRELLNTSQVAAKQAVVEASFAEFQRDVPDFYPDVDNITKLTGWMAKHELLPTVKNFKTAYAAMVKQDCLNIAPVVQQVASAAVPAVEPEPKTAAPVVPETRISPAAEPVQTPRIQAPSGLNDRTSSSNGNRPAEDANSLTLADIEKMSADEYKRRLKDPAFGKYVEQLEAVAAQKRAQRAASRI